MEYPKNFTTSEGCNSSESGWTMYISSPMDIEDMTGQCNYEDEDEYNLEQGTNVRFTCGEEEHEHVRVRRAVPDNGADTDDSMASDASSGPVIRTSAGLKLVKEKKTGGYVTQKKGIKSEKKGGESSFKKSKKEKGTQ